MWALSDNQRQDKSNSYRFEWHWRSGSATRLVNTKGNLSDPPLPSLSDQTINLGPFQIEPIVNESLKHYFEGMVNRIYPPELQLNKANTSDTEAPFFDLHLSISNLFLLKFMISAMTLILI